MSLESGISSDFDEDDLNKIVDVVVTPGTGSIGPSATGATGTTGTTGSSMIEIELGDLVTDIISEIILVVESGTYNPVAPQSIALAVAAISLVFTCIKEDPLQLAAKKRALANKLKQEALAAEVEALKAEAAIAGDIKLPNLILASRADIVKAVTNVLLRNSIPTVKRTLLIKRG